MEELREAMGIAQDFFQENPEGTLTKEILLARGYTPDENVSLTVNGGTLSSFSLSSSFSLPGAAYYTADGQGRVSAAPGRP